jgi:hypothetical protein
VKIFTVLTELQRFSQAIYATNYSFVYKKCARFSSNIWNFENKKEETYISFWSTVVALCGTLHPRFIKTDFELPSLNTLKIFSLMQNYQVVLSFGTKLVEKIKTYWIIYNLQIKFEY